MKKILLCITFLLMVNFLAADGIDWASPNVAWGYQSPLYVNMIFQPGYSVYGYSVWCWLEGGVYPDYWSWDACYVTGTTSETLLAEFNMPGLPTGECALYVWSMGEDYSVSTTFMVTDTYNVPELWSVSPSTIGLGDVVTVSVNGDYLPWSFSGTLGLSQYSMTLPADLTWPSGDNQYSAVFDLTDVDLSPGGCLVYLLYDENNFTYNINAPAYLGYNSFGSLEGYVTGWGTPYPPPLLGAEVNCAGQTAYTDMYGYYLIQDVPTGYHLVTCSAQGYYPASAFATILEDQTTQQDFNMEYGTLDPSPDEINQTVNPDATFTIDVSLVNDGPHVVDYNAYVQMPPRGANPYTIITNIGQSVSPDHISHGSNENNSDIGHQNGRAFGDLLFSYDVQTPVSDAYLAGAETDGTYYYVTKWNGTSIFKYDLQGNYIETFTIAGVTSLRDLAYDGTYFYGSDAGSYIWEMDFDSQTLVSTIPCPVNVRAIAYDNGADAFWVNNWSEDLQLVDRSGQIIDTITNPASMYGMAYDAFSDGGPYLWCFEGTTTSTYTCWLDQVDIATGLPTGVQIGVSDVLGTGIAGGLFIDDTVVPGLVTIGGLMQGQPVDLLFGFELTTSQTWCSITANPSGQIPGFGSIDMEVTLDATDMTVGEVHNCNIVIENDAGVGDDVIVPVTMLVDYIAVDDPQSHFDMSFLSHYPNPVKHTATISYAISGKPVGQPIQVKIYNSLGQLIDMITAENGTAEWNVEKVPSGVYFYSIKTGSTNLTNKLLIIK